MKINEFINSQLRLSPVTLKDYARDLSAFKLFAKVDEPDVDSILGYVNYLKKDNKSQAHISRTLYALKKYCKWRGLLDVFDKVEVPPLEFRQVTHALLDGDVEKLYENAETPLGKAVLTLLAHTGMRIGELLKIKIDDISFDSGTIEIIRKGRRERREVVPLFPSTIRILEEYIGSRKNGKLFPYDYHQLYWLMKKLEAKAGVKFPRYSFFHNLRHHFVISQRLAGVALEDISQATGHASVNVTAKVYGNLSPEELRRRLKEPKWAR